MPLLIFWGGCPRHKVAFERTPLFDYAKHLPDGYYITGDAAYSVGEKMLTPFTGGHQSDPPKDAYNFFLVSFEFVSRCPSVS
jgi:hypothetical protein